MSETFWVKHTQFDEDTVETTRISVAGTRNISVTVEEFCRLLVEAGYAPEHDETPATHEG